MSLHSLLSVTVGVPNVDETAAYYDQLWTPEDLEGARGLFAWARRRPPPSCIPRTSRP